MRVRVETVLSEDDALLDELGATKARWVYAELWARLRRSFEEREGHLYEALRREVEAMYLEADKRYRDLPPRQPRALIDQMLDERDLLEQLRDYLAYKE